MADLIKFGGLRINGCSTRSTRVLPCECGLVRLGLGEAARLVRARRHRGRGGDVRIATEEAASFDRHRQDSGEIYIMITVRL